MKDDIELKKKEREKKVEERTLELEQEGKSKEEASVLGKPAVEAVKDGRIKFVPAQYTNMYYSWMNDLQDWCISRQLWWGHRIPAWYDDNGKGSNKI